MVNLGFYIPADVNFTLADIASKEEPNKILLVSPDYFDIIDVKNPYMEGEAGNISKSLVNSQWETLKKVYDGLKNKGLLKEVSVIPGAPGCEDMVFCANQSLPWQKADGSKVVVLSNMRYPSRQKEVTFFEDFYKTKGYEVKRLHSKDLLEGNGDFILHPGKNLYWAGYGHRSGLEAIKEAALYLDCVVIPVKLVSEHFYHLDTCFVPLGEDAVMLCEEAFDAESLNMIKTFFKKVHAIPREEAVNTFCLNAVALRFPGGEKVAIIQSGSPMTNNILKSHGYEVVEVETGEYMKSGGSVFCMKMMYF